MTSPTCIVENAHCEDCGSTELTVDQWGPICAECDGAIVNADQCAGEHEGAHVRRCVICGCPEGGLYPAACCSDPDNIEED